MSSPDPRPQPPVRPDLEDCCRSGCTPCVFDLYEDALERYRKEFAAWEARQAQAARERPRGQARLPTLPGC